MKSKKGIVLTTNMLAMIILVVVAVFVLLMLWGSFASEAGSPVSEIYFKLFDWIASLLT